MLAKPLVLYKTDNKVNHYVYLHLDASITKHVGGNVESHGGVPLHVQRGTAKTSIRNRCGTRRTAGEGSWCS